MERNISALPTNLAIWSHSAGKTPDGLRIEDFYPKDEPHIRSPRFDLGPFQSYLFQLNLRLNGPDDPFKGSFGQLIVSIPFHCPIRLTFQFLERGEVVGPAGARATP